MPTYHTAILSKYIKGSYEEGVQDHLLIGNKIVFGEFMVITLLVDYPNNSYKDLNEVTIMIKRIENRYGNICIYFRKFNKYLRVDFYWTVSGQMSILMGEYVTDTIKWLLELIKEMDMSPLA